MGDKKKVVMVDDESDLCELVKENLEETGNFEVLTASQAEEGEALCRQAHPDIILLDNVMPGKKGSEIAKALKSDEQTKDIPIIMVSGKGEMVFSKKKEQFQWLPNNPVARERGEVVDGKNPEALSEAYGVDDYVSKPFTTELLVSVIEDVLKRTRKNEEEDEGEALM